MGENVIRYFVWHSWRYLLLLAVLCFPCGIFPAIWDFSISSKDRVVWKLETGKPEVCFFLLSCFTWPWYTSQRPAGCLRKLQISHNILYFYSALPKVILIFQVQFLFFFFNSILLFILFLDENAFQNFRLLHERKLQNFCQLEIHKTYNLLGYSWLICNFYTLFSVWVVKIEWHMVWILRYITFRAE